MFRRQSQLVHPTGPTAEFWQLLLGGQIDQALEYYEVELTQKKVKVPRQVQAAYHTHAWVATQGVYHVEALQKLAHTEPANSQIFRAYRLILQLTAEKRMAEILKTRSPRNKLLDVPKPLSAKTSMLVKLGRAVIEALQTYQGLEKRQQGRLTLRQLPKKEQLPQRFHALHDNLFVWAHWVQNNHLVLFQNPTLLTQLSITEPDRFLLTATRKWGKQALLDGNVQEAVRSLQMARRELARSPSVRISFIIEWALAVIEAKIPHVIPQWFEHSTVQSVLEEDTNSKHVVDFMLLLDSLSQGQVNNSHQYAECLRDADISSELNSQLYYLQALALIRTALPSEESKSTQENTLNWLAIWRDLRRSIIQIADQLTKTENGWRGHILIGLISYADRDAVVSDEQLIKYRQAIEHVQDANAHPALQNIAGILLNRSQATERAIEYIQADDHARLKVLYDEILVALGDIVPPLIRAAVYMYLWEADPQFNPLPDLRRIPITADTEDHISRCIEKVQFLNAVQEITDHMRTLHTGLPDDLIISYVVVNRQPYALALFQLSHNLISLLQGDWTSLEQLHIDDQTKLQMIDDYLRFYSLWQQGQYEVCHDIVIEGQGNRYLIPYRSLVESVKLRTLVNNLDNGRHELVSHDLWRVHIVSDLLTPVGFSSWFFQIATWLLSEKREQALQTLLDVLSKDLEDNPLGQDAMIDWQLAILSGFAAAQSQKYSLAIDLMDTVLNHRFEVPERWHMLVVWARLVRIKAEIGRASVTDNIQQLWPSMVRTINSHLEHLPENPRVVLGYRHLFVGMLTFVTSNTLVDVAIIDSLFLAQRVLTLERNEDYLNHVLTTLQSRRQMVDEFWNAVSKSDFKNAKNIYSSQIRLALRESVPDSIELAMILVDWILNTADVDQLVRRINSLLQMNASMERLGKRLKDIINQHEQIYQVKSMLQNGNYEGLITLVANQWQGTYPPHGAEVSLLFSYMKKKQNNEAIALLERTATWHPGSYTDYRDLLAGYIYFERENYEEAGNRFAAIGMKQLAGKDTNRYWATTRFQNGMQLLKVGRQEEALNEFLAYLRELRSNTAAIHIDLAKTLLYFGIRNIRSGSGSHALEAFSHTGQMLKEHLAENPTSEIFYFLARLGEILTQSLMQDPEIGIVESEAYRKLADEYKVSPTFKQQDISNPHSLFYFLYLIACYQLSIAYRIRQAASSETALQARQRTKLSTELARDLQSLEKLLQQIQQNDVVFLILKALLLVRFQKDPDYVAAIEQLNVIINNLGVKTSRLTEVVEQLQNEYDSERHRAENILKLLDPLLIEGDLLAGSDSTYVLGDETVHKLYEIYREVTPKDIPRIPMKNTLEIIDERVVHLKQWLENSGVVSKRSAKQYIIKLEKQAEVLRESYLMIAIIEEEIIKSVAQSFYEQK